METEKIIDELTKIHRSISLFDYPFIDTNVPLENAKALLRFTRKQLEELIIELNKEIGV